MKEITNYIVEKFKINKKLNLYNKSYDTRRIK